jgi:hypothetical protein
LFDEQRRGSAVEVLGVATKLGLTSFGGPVAHLAYFRSEYVERRRWIDDTTYGDLLAFTQMLPGPASSQLGIPGRTTSWCASTRSVSRRLAGSRARDRWSSSSSTRGTWDWRRTA